MRETQAARFGEIGIGFFLVALLAIGDATLPIKVRPVRAECDGVVVRGERFAKVPLVPVRHRQANVTVSALVILFDAGLEVGDRSVVVVHFQVGHAPFPIIAVMMWIQMNGFVVMR